MSQIFRRTELATCLSRETGERDSNECHSYRIDKTRAYIYARFVRRGNRMLRGYIIISAASLIISAHQRSFIPFPRPRKLLCVINHRSYLKPWLSAPGVVRNWFLNCVFTPRSIRTLPRYLDIIPNGIVYTRNRFLRLLASREKRNNERHTKLCTL